VLTVFPKSMAWIIPAGEIVIAGILLIPPLKLTGLYAAMGTMLLFTAYLVTLHVNNIYLPCSCGGFLETIPWKAHVILNAVLILLGISGIILIKRSRLPKQLIS